MKKSLIQLKNETFQNEKFNHKAIFILAWDRIKKGVFKNLKDAMNYAWDLAKEFVKELREKALAFNTDFSSFTKFS